MRRRILGLALATTLCTTLALPVYSQPSSQISDNLTQLTTIPLKNFPTVILTPEVVNQFAAAGTPLPAAARVGQEMRPEDIFHIATLRTVLGSQE